MKRLLTAIAISLSLGTAQAQTTVPTLLADIQMARAIANWTVVIKELEYVSGGLGTLSPVAREAYLLAGTGNVLYYAQQSQSAFQAAGVRYSIVDAVLGGILAAAQDVGAAAGLPDWTGADVPLYKADGTLNTSALTNALTIWVYSGTTLDGFLDLASQSGNRYTQRVAQTQAALNQPSTPPSSPATNQPGSTGAINAIVAVPQLPPFSGPAVGAFAIGDGGYPVAAGTLDNYTLASNGGLQTFSSGSGLDSGSHQAVTAGAGTCSAADCPYAGTIRWGVWSSAATVSISGQPALTPTSANPLAWIMGTPTTPAQYAALSGTATFNQIGGTALPSGYTASTVGPISVNFTTNSATLTQYTVVPTASPNSTQFAFSNVTLNVVNSLDNTARQLNGWSTNGAGSTLTVNGFFAGPAANFIGLGLKTTDLTNTINLNQVQAFKR